jgi:hypothetical protein
MLMDALHHDMISEIFGHLQIDTIMVLLLTSKRMFIFAYRRLQGLFERCNVTVLQREKADDVEHYGYLTSTFYPSLSEYSDELDMFDASFDRASNGEELLLYHDFKGGEEARMKKEYGFILNFFAAVFYIASLVSIPLPVANRYKLKMAFYQHELSDYKSVHALIVKEHDTMLMREQAKRREQGKEEVWWNFSI